MNAHAASTGSGSRIIEELAEAIGEQAALDLAWAFRGLTLYVPMDPATNEEIGKAIGAEAAAKLCDVLGGLQIYMPINEPLERKVLSLSAGDEPTLKPREIAKTLGVAERRVYRIIERARTAREADDQPRLL